MHMFIVLNHRRAPMAHLLSLSLCTLLLQVAAQSPISPVPATSSATKPKSSHSHSGSPFSAFTKSLPQEKKKPFMELMKRLRGARNQTGTKEEKKKSTTTLDVDIHKLLGTDYKRYRTTLQSAKEAHATKKGATMQGPPPPPPLIAATSTPSKKKKSGSSTKGSASKSLSSTSTPGKKKKSSTTMGAAP